MTIQFNVLRVGTDIVGFSLIGVGNTEEECFCYSFPSVVGNEGADVTIEDSEEDSYIIFRHPGCHPADNKNPLLYSDGGEHREKIGNEDAHLLHQLITLSGPYSGQDLVVTFVKAFGRGFELNAKPK